MSKTHILSIRMDIEHLTKLHSALKRRGIQATNMSEIVRMSTIGFLAQTDPGCIHSAPDHNDLMEVTSMIGGKHKKGNAYNKMINLMEQFTQPAASPGEHIQSPVDAAQIAPAQPLENLSGQLITEKLQSLAHHRHTAIKQMPTDIQTKAERAWQCIATGALTIDDNLYGENMEAAGITALILQELSIHDSDLLTTEQKEKVRELTSRLI